ncbi:MAG: S8 family serine peptidase, partial [Nanoarchaeota archaeon]|nr:S8 family serine peptidase [Nanoarchaeota archaeon]
MENKIALLFFLIISFNFVIAEVEFNKFSSEITDGEIPLIIFRNSSEELVSQNMENIYSALNASSCNFTEKEFRYLKKDKENKVFLDKKVYAYLYVSVPQIGGIDSQNLIAQNFNLTGNGQTVCIIDTGVNYNLASLGGCYGDNSSCVVIGGYDFVNNDSDPMDDNGHGTFVAGIISSSNSIYKGVSPFSKIIAIKALDINGTGNAFDVIAGISWCVANALKFNISVISMSLGDCSAHSTYCNDNELFTPAIDVAASKNISVVVAAGNGDTEICRRLYNITINETQGVSSPACVENATAVGAVNDSDSIFFQRGPLFEL